MKIQQLIDLLEASFSEDERGELEIYGNDVENFYIAKNNSYLGYIDRNDKSWNPQ